jgi:hypothetical protein
MIVVRRRTRFNLKSSEESRERCNDTAVLVVCSITTTFALSMSFLLYNRNNIIPYSSKVLNLKDSHKK